jgi:hypothetical protein
MKATLLSTLIAFFCLYNVQSQDAYPVGSEGNNELKINLLYVVLEAVELDYERILNQDVSVGLSANYWFAEYSDFNFMAIPYFRFYPAEKLRASGFFIEGNMALIGYDSYESIYRNGYWTGEEKARVSIGAGIAVGGKFISKSGFFGEVFGGLGRIFDDENYLELYPRVGISIGKRF